MKQFIKRIVINSDKLIKYEIKNPWDANISIVV